MFAPGRPPAGGTLPALLAGAVLLSLASAAVALAPAAAVVLAPAMRTMLANATQAAVSALGTTAVRATIPRTVAVGGVGVTVNASRTLGAAAVATGALGLAAGGTAMVDWMAQGRCRFGASGVECDLGTAQSTQTGRVWFGYSGSQYPTRAPNAAFTTPLAAANADFAVWWAAFKANDPARANWAWSHVTCNIAAQATSGQCWLYYNRISLTGANTGQGAQDMLMTSTVSAYQFCPEVNGQSVVAGADGRCPTGIYTRQSPAAALQHLTSNGAATPSPLVDIARDAANRGAEWDETQAPQELDGPATVALPQTVTETTESDGTTVRTVKTPVASMQYYGSTVTWTITETITTTRTVPGGQPQTTTTTSTTAPPVGTPTPAPQPVPAEQPEDIECGLPGKPPCKIDETGTPEFEDPFSPDDPTAPLTALIDAPTVADVEFSWTLQLPSTCDVLTVGEFAGEVVEFDLCQYQPMIHDLMSIVWAITGLLGGLLILRNGLNG